MIESVKTGRNLSFLSPKPSHLGLNDGALGDCRGCETLIQHPSKGGTVPIISVVMPVYNAEKYLRRAVESILQQTFSDFELIAIDDGSSDNSLAILESYADPRIRIIQNPANLRLIKTLNIGIRESRGKYIARMDADDISFVNRFSTQIALLESGDYDVVASSYQAIDMHDNYIGDHWNYSCDNMCLAFMLCICNPFIHPTIMGRRDLFERYLYCDSEYSLHVEDMELWVRMMRDEVKFHLSSEKLLFYRRAETNITIIHNDEALPRHIAIARQWQLATIGVALTDQSMKILLRCRVDGVSFSNVWHAVAELRSAAKMYLARSGSVRCISFWFRYRIVVAILSSQLSWSARFVLMLMNLDAVFVAMIIGGCLVCGKCAKWLRYCCCCVRI